MRSRIFVVDDEPAMGENIKRMLRSVDASIESFEDPQTALELALQNAPDVLLLDVKMPGMSGEEFFARFHQDRPAVPVILLTAFGSIEGAVIAMRHGAFDYLQKPFQREDLLLAVERALKQGALERQVRQLRGRLDALGESDEPQTQNAAMAAQIDIARRAAPTDATVMIQGESGTGKEVMARFVHDQSLRRDGPFVAVECSAMASTLVESELFGYERGAFTGAERLKAGLIESAQGGTLFLDEIGDLGIELQTRLFRFVAEREVRRVGGVHPVKVDCRIICASNQNLRGNIKAGTFREELYYRLSVVTVSLPALRDRRENIPQLASSFLKRFSRQYGKKLTPSPEFLEALTAQHWPGNVRQLKNAMERIAVLHPGGILNATDVFNEPSSVADVDGLVALPWKEARDRYLANIGMTYANAVLARCGGNISAASREAGVDRKTFYALLRRESIPQPVE